MPVKPTRIRALWRIGELTGAQAAMDAGAVTGAGYAQSDHYDAGTGEVHLRMETARGRRLCDVLCAIHEAMHARQWAERTWAVRLHQLGARLWLPWVLLCGCAVLFFAAFMWFLTFCEWQQAVRLFWLTLGCLGAMLALSVFKAGSILNVEREAWAMTKRWLDGNYEVSFEQRDVIEMIAASGMRSYVRGFFDR